MKLRKIEKRKNLRVKCYTDKPGTKCPGSNKK